MNRITHMRTKWEKKKKSIQKMLRLTNMKKKKKKEIGTHKFRRSRKNAQFSYFASTSRRSMINLSEHDLMNFLFLLNLVCKHLISCFLFLRLRSPLAIVRQQNHHPQNNNGKNLQFSSLFLVFHVLFDFILWICYSFVRF